MSDNPLRLPRGGSLRRKGVVREIVPGGKRRPPGSGVRQSTVSVKDALLSAFEKVGGEDYLVLLARKEPKVFAAMLARCLPTKVEADEALTAAIVGVVTGVARNPGDPVEPPVIDGEAEEVMH